MSLPDGQRTIGPHFVADADLAGLLFDCDGTLIDTMPLFYHSWAEVCPQHGLSMSEDDFYGFAGKPLHRAGDAPRSKGHRRDRRLCGRLSGGEEAGAPAGRGEARRAGADCVRGGARAWGARARSARLPGHQRVARAARRAPTTRRLLIERRLPTGCGSTSSGTSRAQGSRTSSTRGWGTWCARRRWRQAQVYTRWHEKARRDGGGGGHALDRRGEGRDVEDSRRLWD